MGLPFGAGQFFAAAVLYRTLECRDDHRNRPRDDASGRFAYEGLERVFHEKARLGIMTSLVSHPKGLVFSDLKELCALTDGNLSRHLQVLHEAGLIEVWKGFHRNRPQTVCRITDEGKRRFLDYINVLENVVADALKAAESPPPPARRSPKAGPPPETRTTPARTPSPGPILLRGDALSRKVHAGFKRSFHERDPGGRDGDVLRRPGRA